jgi:hypothetical protein
MKMEYDPVPVSYEVACHAAIDRVSTNGADLSKPTELTFYNYFPKRDNAELFVECLRDEGFQAQLLRPHRRPKDSATEKNWEVVLRLNNKPERRFIDSVSARLEDFATKRGGEYDGWEALIAP